MIYFKSCPRCSGDRELERDIYGWYMLCLTCGYVTYPEVGIEAAKPHEEDRKTGVDIGVAIAVPTQIEPPSATWRVGSLRSDRLVSDERPAHHATAPHRPSAH